MSLFPRVPRPPKRLKRTPRAPKNWPKHLCIDAGQRDWDDEILCNTCGFRADHKVHAVDFAAAGEAAAIDARRLGERSEQG